MKTNLPGWKSFFPRQKRKKKQAREPVRKGGGEKSERRQHPADLRNTILGKNLNNKKLERIKYL